MDFKSKLFGIIILKCCKRGISYKAVAYKHLQVISIVKRKYCSKLSVIIIISIIIISLLFLYLIISYKNKTLIKYKNT